MLARICLYMFNIAKGDFGNWQEINLYHRSHQYDKEK